MSASCPISLRRIDSNTVRVISIQVALFGTVLIFTQEKIFAFILLFDFAMRVMRLEYITPFGLIARFVLNLSKAVPNLCDESPKRFALYLGFSISLLVVIFFIFGFTTTASIITAILVFCSLLEASFDFCVGCKIYYLLQLSKRLWTK